MQTLNDGFFLGWTHDLTYTDQFQHGLFWGFFVCLFFVFFSFAFLNKASLMYIAGFCQTAQAVYITIIKSSYLKKKMQTLIQNYGGIIVIPFVG